MTTKVDVTVDYRGKKVALDKVGDTRIRSALEQMAKDVGAKLAKAKCPEHKQSPTDIRLHVNASFDADLKYESCCEKLKDAVAKAL
jgi:hypothetical protein